MRIISLAPAITEILFALGEGKSVVADTYFCDYPPPARNIPKAGDFSHPDLTRIRAFKPDLVITSTTVQKHAKQIFGKEKFTHVHYDPRSLSDIYDSITDLGIKLDLIRRAKNTVLQMKKREAKIRAGKPRRRYRVYCEEWFDPPMISGNWVPDIVEIAGGEYYPLIKGEPSRKIMIRDLIRFNPEVIFLSDCGFGTRSNPDKIYERISWRNLIAVRNRRVIPIDESILNRPGPRILEAASMLQEKLSALE